MTCLIHWCSSERHKLAHTFLVARYTEANEMAISWSQWSICVIYWPLTFGQTISFKYRCEGNLILDWSVRQSLELKSGFAFRFHNFAVSLEAFNVQLWKQNEHECCGAIDLFWDCSIICYIQKSTWCLNETPYHPQTSQGHLMITEKILLLINLVDI